MPDESFEVQLAVVREQLRQLRQLAEGVEYVVREVHANAERLAVHEDRFEALRDELKLAEGRMEKAVSRVEKSCNDLGTQIRAAAAAYGENVTARLNYRSAVTVAAIAAAATLLAGKL